MKKIVFFSFFVFFLLFGCIEWGGAETSAGEKAQDEFLGQGLQSGESAANVGFSVEEPSLAVADFYSSEDCNIVCLIAGYEKGECKEVTGESQDGGSGTCIISSLSECSEEGNCNCYCYNETRDAPLTRAAVAFVEDEIGENTRKCTSSDADERGTRKVVGYVG